MNEDEPRLAGLTLDQLKANAAWCERRAELHRASMYSFQDSARRWQHAADKISKRMAEGVDQ